MILLCKALYKAFAVFVQSSLQVVCHAGVQDSISFVGQKVDIILFHALTAFLGVEFAEAFLLSERVLRDCHVGLRPPRNDKSGGQHCFNGGRYGSGMLSRDCTPRALPRASRSGRHVASLLAMTNRGPLPFYRYPIRIGGAAPGAACRSPTAHGRRSVYFSFFIFQSSGFISMRPSPTTHYRFLASGVDFSCASCSARMMRFETSQPRGVRYQREPLCAARPCPAKRSSSCCSGAKGSR